MPPAGADEIATVGSDVYPAPIFVTVIASRPRPPPTVPEQIPDTTAVAFDETPIS